MTKYTTIAVSSTVRAELAKHGIAGETMNDVLERVLNIQEQKKTAGKKAASQGSSRHNGLPAENTTSSDAS